MTNPPKPHNTDPNQHAPGISKTLEENAAASEEFRNRKREDSRAADEAKRTAAEEV